MPPDLRTIGASPFAEQQRARLSGWLHEAAWPRERMEVTALEGYLVALIAWPVGIPTGAWLPPIWGERGWKVPTKIAARSQYEEFVALVVGFMRELDRNLTRQPSRFESSVLRGLNEGTRDAGLQAWGKGFMTALTLGSQGLKWRSDSAGAAVRDIAANTSASAPLGPHAIEDVVSAVFSLMAQRGSRGPLGPLEMVATTRSI
jgi:yecA family protein